MCILQMLSSQFERRNSSAGVMAADRHPHQAISHHRNDAPAPATCQARRTNSMQRPTAGAVQAVWDVLLKGEW